jgi:hypothetical protein
MGAQYLQLSGQSDAEDAMSRAKLQRELSYAKPRLNGWVWCPQRKRDAKHLWHVNTGDASEKMALNTNSYLASKLQRLVLGWGYLHHFLVGFGLLGVVVIPGGNNPPSPMLLHIRAPGASPTPIAVSPFVRLPILIFLVSFAIAGFMIGQARHLRSSSMSVASAPLAGDGASCQASGDLSDHEAGVLRRGPGLPRQFS